MSEVGDAVQVVMLFGRGAMLVGNISLKLAMQIVKLMNTIYLAKWEGKVSLNRLRQTKGDDFVFINVSSEKMEDLAAVEKEMKAHGIMFARMPDLCGGDARTQYAIASSDAVKMKAMLLDHTAGPNRHIRVGPISEADYMMTGKRADGTDTKEMNALNKSAQETVNQSRNKESVRPVPGTEGPGKNRAKPDKKPEKSKKAPVRESVHVVRKDVPSQESLKKDAPLQKVDMTVHPVMARSIEEKQLQAVISDVRIRSQDYQRQYGTDSVFWIKQKPLYENRYYAQFLMPDGKNTIFVRQADILPGRDAGTGMRLAAVFMDQRYSMMNLEKVNVIAADGSKAIAMFKLPGGVVVAQGSQQPDRKKTGPEIGKGGINHPTAKEGSRSIPAPKKGKAL